MAAGAGGLRKKKLTDACEKFYAGGVDPAHLEQLKASNAPQWMIDREAGRGTIEILESNVEIFNLFVRSQTQWVRDTMGRLQGLNYIQVEFIAGRIGVELDADNFEKLQTLETKAKDLANDGAS